MGLYDEEIGVKALVGFNEEIKQFFADLDGKPYEGYLYLESDFNPYNKQVKVLTADVMINGKVISEGTMEWQPSAL